MTGLSEVDFIVLLFGCRGGLLERRTPFGTRVVTEEVI